MRNNLLILCYAVFILFFLVLGWLYPILPQDDMYPMVSKAVETIDNVSHTPHSFRNPTEREKVKKFLVEQLSMLGVSSREYRYDSILTRTGDYVTAKNIYASIGPENASDTTRYLLLIAHYDSTGKFSPTDSTRFSFGAADNGYGLGVILALTEKALERKKEWKQGLRILFTDLEEEKTAGMLKAVEYAPEIFGQVNLAINIDARGVKGAALLSECSQGNARILDLYQTARHPYCYSLTSFIYRMMPNYTDFGCIRDSIPGMSFAVIDNLDYYHTFNDNFSNISEDAIRHYLTQISPMMREYLESATLNQPDSFKTEQNEICFTVPFLSLVRISPIGWLISNLCCLLFFMVTAGYCIRKRKIKIGSVLRKGIMIVLSLPLLFILGTTFAYLLSILNERPFQFMSTLYISADRYLFLGFIGTCIIIPFWGWIRLKSRKIRLEWFLAFGASLNILSFILFLVIRENFFLLIPALAASMCIPTYPRIWTFIACNAAMILLALTETALMKQLYLALTIGSTGFLAMIFVPAGLMLALMGYQVVLSLSPGARKNETN